jgi:hypothetical protein
VKSKAKEAQTLKISNDKKNEEYSKALAAIDEATREFWDDWSEQRERLEFAKGWRDLFEDYLNVCNQDAELASRFLRKVPAYSKERLEEAEEFVGPFGFLYKDLPKARPCDVEGGGFDE